MIVPGGAAMQLPQIHELFSVLIISLIAGLGASVGRLITVLRSRQHGHQHAVAFGIISGATFVFLLSGLVGV